MAEYGRILAELAANLAHLPRKRLAFPRQPT
jgi:hypothetical protein